MKISIITVVFNRVKEIEETINNVISQNYSNLEYIVIDGASNDGTIDIIKKYQNSIHKWISEPDEGIYYAINKGLKLATGDIIGLVHAGDSLANSHTLQKISDSIKSYNTDIIYGNTLLVEENNPNKIKRIWQGSPFKISKFKYGWMPSHVSVFIKKQVFEKYGDYRTDLPIGADYELLLRFMYKYKVSSAWLNSFIQRFRTGGVSNNGLKNILKANIECYKSWKLNNLKVPIYTIPLKILRRIPDYFRSSKNNDPI